MNWSLSIVLLLLSAAEVELVLEQPASVVEEAPETFESFELVLTDGQILEGRALERVDGSYHLELRSGRTLVMPADAVKQLKLRRIGKEDPPTGIRVVAKGELLPGSSGDAKLPSTAEQLAKLPPAAEFQESIIDPVWQPRSDWDNDQAQNNFNPVRWAKSPIDSTWTPEDGFARKKAFWDDSAESYVVPDPPPADNTRARDLARSGESRPRPGGVVPPDKATSAETPANPEKSGSPRSN